MGRLVATHQLDDDVDVVVGHQVRRRVGQDSAGMPARGGAPDVAHGDGGELEGGAIGRRQSPGRSRSARDDLAPDGPRAEHADAQRAPLMTGSGGSRHRSEW